MIGVSAVFDLVEQFGQRRLAAILVLFGSDVLLGLHDLLGDLQQLLQELDAVDHALTRCRSFSASSRSASSLNLGLPACSAKRRDELDLDLLGLLRVGVREHRLEQIGVQHQRLEVVADGVDMDVLVDQLDRLGPERVPEQLAVAAGGLHRLVDLRSQR